MALYMEMVRLMRDYARPRWRQKVGASGKGQRVVRGRHSPSCRTSWAVGFPVLPNFDPILAVIMVSIVLLLEVAAGAIAREERGDARRKKAHSPLHQVLCPATRDTELLHLQHPPFPTTNTNEPRNANHPAHSSAHYSQSVQPPNQILNDSSPDPSHTAPNPIVEWTSTIPAIARTATWTLPSSVSPFPGPRRA